jgi:arsenate reductase-like glutaredoxin family protein
MVISNLNLNFSTNLYLQHGAKNVVTLFHKPSNQASTRVLTLLKQANAQSVATATEDQASSHKAQNKAERTEFEFDVTEEPPTTDQLKSILDYLGGTDAAGRVISGAENESDAMRRLKADGNAFHRPLVVDWNQGKAGECKMRRLMSVYANARTVVGDNESEIMKLIHSVPKKA